MNVLALNHGSSSLKYGLFAVDSGAARRLAGGKLDVLAADHRDAQDRVLQALADAGFGPTSIDAAGHRVVHGGHFDAPVLIDDAVLAAVERATEQAPLHNAASLAGIRAARAALGESTPMVAVFDTAFHHTIPEHAALYAIPRDLAAAHGIRRVGFHGISHRYLAMRYGQIAGRSLAGTRLITLHLGNGCSVTATRDGRSVDTSMGFTPLEGLVMGTRSGDIDPAAALYLAEHTGLGPAGVERLLNKGSGLLGLSGLSGDVRELLAAEAAGHEGACLALDAYCYRARKYLGAYLATLGGAPALILSARGGERPPAKPPPKCEGRA